MGPKNSRAIHPPLAVVYDVEPVIVGRSADETETIIRRDFQEASKLGFDTVLACELDLKMAPMVQAAADAARLKVVMDDGSAAIALDSGTTTDRSLRSQTAWVRLSEVASSPPSVADPLLAQYYEELLKGRTGGLVVVRFRSLPGDGPDLSGIVAGSEPQAATVLARLLDRFRRWGDYLDHAVVRCVEPAAGQREIVIASMERNARRFALIANSSRERSVRGEVGLGGDGTIFSRIESAIEVPSASDSPVGRVFRGHDGHVTISVDLPPGDAMLVELF